MSFTICALPWDTFPLCANNPTIAIVALACAYVRLFGRTGQPRKRGREPLRPASLCRSLSLSIPPSLPLSLSLSPSLRYTAPPRPLSFVRSFMVNSWRVSGDFLPAFLVPSFSPHLDGPSATRVFQRRSPENGGKLAKKLFKKFGAKTGGKRVRRVERDTDTARDGAGGVRRRRRRRRRRPRRGRGVDKAEVRAEAAAKQVWAQSVSRDLEQSAEGLLHSSAQPDPTTALLFTRGFPKGESGNCFPN